MQVFAALGEVQWLAELVNLLHRVPENPRKSSGGQEGLPNKAAKQDVGAKGDVSVER